MTEDVFIGMGSNLGDRAGQIEAAVKMIGESPRCEVRETSPLYETEPLGEDSGGWFLNGVIRLDTGLSPHKLYKFLQRVENALGRRRRRRWEPRTLDLDILFYGNRVIHNTNLIIPHPQLHLRRFVLTPLVSIAPDFVHPVLGETVSELYNSLQDNLKVIPWS